MIEWKCIPIKALGRVVTGKTPPTSNKDYFKNGSELFVSPKDLDWDQGYVTETETSITALALGKFKNQVIPRDSIMFTSLSFAFGKMGISSCNCLTNQQINSIVINDDHDNRFVYYLLKAYRATIFSYNSGIDTPIVPKSVFESIEIKCPPLQIQQKISSILGSYDDLIETNKQHIALLERVAEEIYKEWFVRWRFPGHDQSRIVSGVPDGWRESIIGSFGKVVTGKTPSKGVSANFGGSIPFIKTPDMGQGIFIINTDDNLSLQGAETQKSQYLPKNTICTSCIGSVGEVSITTRESQTNQQINSIILTDDIYREYLYLTIKRMKPVIEAYGATGATMTNLSKGKFEALKVVKPNREIVKHFHAVLKDAFEEILVLSQKNEILKQTRDLLLPRLISGKMSVEHLLDDQ